MRLLLDTHTFLWFVWGDSRLSAAASALIQDPANECLVSTASAWEIAIKTSSGKLTLGQPVGVFLGEQLHLNQFALIGVELPHITRVAELPFHHRDPFDRMLAAQSLVEGVPLLSIDAVFDGYGVDRRWL
jgi:PIN domain nuclease of toxin-antitoxin system